MMKALIFEVDVCRKKSQLEQDNKRKDVQGRHEKSRWHDAGVLTELLELVNHVSTVNQLVFGLHRIAKPRIACKP